MQQREKNRKFFHLNNKKISLIHELKRERENANIRGKRNKTKTANS